MRIALTGASGFTGAYVARALTSRGVECVSLDVDLRDVGEVDAVVQEQPFDCLIHLAAKAFVDSSDWASFYAVNQVGTFHLLDAVARHRPGTRCILASSAQVYGPTAQGMVDENVPANPANHYAVSKFAMETGARLWGDRLALTIARPFNYTGVGQEPVYLIPKIVKHFRDRASAIELGNLWVKRDFGDVRSVAEAYVGLALADQAPSLVNICTGRVSTIGEILDTLRRLSGHDLEVRVNPAFVRKNDVETLGGSVDRLSAALPDWAPIELDDTLDWMLGAPSEG